MLSTDLNKKGKRYDAFSPWYLLIKVTKGDKKGDLLTRLSRGTPVGYRTHEDAMKAQAEFMDAAAGILASNYGENEKAAFSSYGMTAIINEETGHVDCVAHLGTDPDPE